MGNGSLHLAISRSSELSCCQDTAATSWNELRAFYQTPIPIPESRPLQRSNNLWFNLDN